MTANPDAILAGVGPTGLAWFGAHGTTMPISATATLDAGFLDAGLITEDGVTRGVDENSNDINAYGLFVPARTLTTSSKVTFELTFLESNPVALAVYHRLPLDELVPDVDGAFDFTEGEARTIQYAAVFDVVDRSNHIRAACPSLQVTDRNEIQVQAGEGIDYGVTMTAFPGSDGVAVHWWYVVNALASVGS